MRKTPLTIEQKILLSLLKHRDGASWRRLAGWHNKKNYSSLYQTLFRLKKGGLVSRVNEKFIITEAGIKEVLEEK